MTKVLCLTGWQQPEDALAGIAPDAMHFDYSGFDDTQSLFNALPPAPDLAIGWSLGGQLLVRAIAGGYVKPKGLLLLGAPFQWVADEHFKKGFPPEAVAGVQENYSDDAMNMVRNLNGLVALGDAYERRIIKQLNARAALWKQGHYWLGELARTTCRPLEFSGFPPTTILHGAKDRVIVPANAEAYAGKLPMARLLLWPDAAHAPQLHDQEALRKIVQEHV